MIFDANFEAVFVADIDDPPSSEGLALVGRFFSMGPMSSEGVGALLLPMFTLTGHFDSVRPTYNEFIPTVEQICQMFMQLLPKGRALSTHDLSIPKENNPVRQFWCAVAQEWEKLERVAVEMVDEAFCTFARDDIDGWKQDYILPDEELVYGNNICSKSNRIGALTVAEYRRIAESIGWTLIDLRFLKGDDEEFPGVFATLYVEASIDSPIIGDPGVSLLGDDFILGSSVLGEIGLPEAVAKLEGLYDRVLPAHVDLDVEVV